MMNGLPHPKNHGPLTQAEQAELSVLMSKLGLAYQQSLDEGVACLPPNMRARAKLDWCRRWE